MAAIKAKLIRTDAALLPEMLKTEEYVTALLANLAPKCDHPAWRATCSVCATKAYLFAVSLTMRELRRFTQSVEVRFWKKVLKTEGCWTWTGRLDINGYGHIRDGCGRTSLAHRISWEMHYGPIPEGKVLLHSCDNPCCVRPDHLTPGTQLQNIEDRCRKQRTPHGSKHHGAKLSEESARLIKRSNESARVLANRFGVTPGTVIKLKKGRTWKSVV